MKILTLDANEELIVIDEEEITKDDALTPEEINALKELAAIAPKLLELANGATQDEKDSDAKDEDKDKVDDEDEEKKRKEAEDSFKSLGANHKASKTGNDSIEVDRQLAIEDAWSKRLKGGN